MDDLTGGLTTAAVVAGAVVAIIQALKGALPLRYARELTDGRAVLLAWLLGPMVSLGLWVLDFAPDLVSWRDAVKIGIAGGIGANGLFSAGKATLGKKRGTVA